MNIFTHVLIDLAVRHPKMAGLIGLLIALVFGALGISSFVEMQKIGDQPQAAALASIATYLASEERYWVRVTDGSLDCQGIYYEQVGQNTNTEIFLVTPGTEIALLITYPEKKACQDIGAGPLQGVAYKMSAQHKTNLATDGRLKGFADSTQFLELCTTCGRSSSAFFIILSAIFALLGLLLYPLALLGKRKRAKNVVSNTADELFEN